MKNVMDRLKIKPYFAYAESDLVFALSFFGIGFYRFFRLVVKCIETAAMCIAAEYRHWFAPIFKENGKQCQ
jgi:hypothetical protein